MLFKRDAKLDLEEDALELEPVYPRRPERPQPNPLTLSQYCLNRVRGTPVAVVGAGFAGLMAARLLCRYGIRVTVYEAYKEVGGRVRSSGSIFSLSRAHARARVKKLSDICHQQPSRRRCPCRGDPRS